MSDDPVQAARPLLEPSERIAEVLFGLIMFLAITGSLRVATAGPDSVHRMLANALGCNLAWGIIDAVLYCMGRGAEQGRGLIVYRAVRKATNPQKAHRLIADALPSVVASILQPAELESIRQRLKQLPEPPDRVRLRKEDWLAGLWVFLWVVLSMFPLAVPFILIHNAALALRASNTIAMVMLFGMGYTYGRCTLRNPWSRGIAMVIVGLTLVALTKVFGG
jgi:VIT1/CCC1 family predicted Fe2+/Mn2+ transporter